MKRDITRKHFLHLGMGASAAALLGACGDDTGDTDASDTGTSEPTTTSPTTTSPTTTSPTTTTTTTPDDSTSGDPSTTMPGTETVDPTTEGTTGDEETTTADPDTGTTGSGGCAADPTIAIRGHEGHALVVTLAEVQAGVEVEYDIMGGSPHTHSVVLSAADFQTLQETGMVIVTSSFDSMHDHMITLTCG